LSDDLLAQGTSTETNSTNQEKNLDSSELNQNQQVGQLSHPLSSSLKEAIQGFEPLPGDFVELSSELYRGYTQKFPDKFIETRVNEASKQIGTVEGATSLSPEDLSSSLESLKSSGLIETFELHSPSENDSGLVLVWLRQSHAEVGVNSQGQYSSAMPAQSVENQKAIILIGQELAKQGVRFFGVENISGDMNYLPDEEAQFAGRKMNLFEKDQLPAQVTDAIDRRMPGFQILQGAYPVIDVLGVDRHRGAIIENHALIDQYYPTVSSMVSDIESGLDSDPVKREAQLKLIRSSENGLEVLKALRAKAQLGFNFFSIADDTMGLDSVGGAIAEQTGVMSERLMDPDFQKLQELKGPFADNVMAMQYGALHSGMIKSALDKGISIIDVMPAGIDPSSFHPETGLNDQSEIAHSGTRHFQAEIELLDKIIEGPK